MQIICFYDVFVATTSNVVARYNISSEVKVRAPDKWSDEMVLRMQYSGYSEKFRHEVVNSALKAYETRKKADQEGERPLHRPREW